MWREQSHIKALPEPAAKARNPTVPAKPSIASIPITQQKHKSRLHIRHAVLKSSVCLLQFHIITETEHSRLGFLGSMFLAMCFRNEAPGVDPRSPNVDITQVDHGPAWCVMGQSKPMCGPSLL